MDDTLAFMMRRAASTLGFWHAFRPKNGATDKSHKPTEQTFMIYYGHIFAVNFTISL